MQTSVAPYCGPAPLPADLAARWNGDPFLIAALAAAFIVRLVQGARPAWLGAGLSVTLLLFVSPLCALGSALFSARVAHHVALTAVAAPLIALALPRGGRGLIAWTLVHGAIFWVWHGPQAYSFALASDWAYWLMQLSLLGSAIGFWRAALSAPAPAATAALLATMVQMGLLGALLTFAGTPIYLWHLSTTQPWGLSPLEDQQLAGLIMWVPGAGIYLIAALRIASGWFGERERLAAA